VLRTEKQTTAAAERKAVNAVPLATGVQGVATTQMFDVSVAYRNFYSLFSASLAQPLDLTA